MYDLATIKRLNRNPSKRNERDKPAPQPTREESQRFYYATQQSLARQRFQMVPPAGRGDTE